MKHGMFITLLMSYSELTMIKLKINVKIVRKYSYKEQK
jgi:hypothetical protein